LFLLSNFTILTRKDLQYLHGFKNSQELALVSLPNTEVYGLAHFDSITKKARSPNRLIGKKNTLLSLPLEIISCEDS